MANGNYENHSTLGRMLDGANELSRGESPESEYVRGQAELIIDSFDYLNADDKETICRMVSGEGD